MSIGAYAQDKTADVFSRGSYPPSYREAGVGHASGALSTEEFVLPFGDKKLILPSPPPKWLRDVLEEVSALGWLERNWDSYGAWPVDPTIAKTAVELLMAILEPDTPVPSIVPTSHGGIQIEWHCSGVDLEVEVVSPLRCEVFFEDERNEKEWEKTLVGDFTPIREAVDVMAKRN